MQSWLHDKAHSSYYLHNYQREFEVLHLYEKKKNNSTFWLACVKPRYKDFNINRCWPTCQSAWCIDCCPLQLKKKMKFWNPNSTLQFKQYKLTFKRSKTCQPACRNLDRRGWCMGWKCVGGIFLDFATVLSKCKELAFVHKKLRYRKDFRLRTAMSNSILVIRW